MSGLPIRDTLSALVAAVKSSAEIQATIGAKIYSHVPQGTPFPYVTISDTTATDNSDKDDNGADIVVRFHAWSRYQGDDECYRIIEGIHGALHNRTITLPAPHQAILCQFELTVPPFLDPDGQTHHCVTSFRVTTSSTVAA